VNVASNTVQPYFGWTAYNRDSYAFNVGMRQMQQYFKKNYGIAWVGNARGDIRSMMGVFVNRINNYMLVATLILGVAGGAVVSVDFSDDSTDFIVYGFYVNISIAIVYLMLCLILAVRGQNLAFTKTMILLTDFIRPENPANYSHDYMKQAQWIEGRGLEMFRIPGMAAGYSERKAEERDAVHGERTSAGASPARKVGNDGALEVLDEGTGHTFYLQKYKRFMELWQPYDTWSRYSMGHGQISLLHTCIYYTLARVMGAEAHHRWVGCALMTPFVLLLFLAVPTYFVDLHVLIALPGTALLVGAPLAAAAAICFEDWQKELMMACFACHLLFWIVTTIQVAAQLGVPDAEENDVAMQCHDSWQGTSMCRQRRFTHTEITFGPRNGYTELRASLQGRERGSPFSEHGELRASLKGKENGSPFSEHNNDDQWPTDNTSDWKHEVKCVAADVKLQVKVSTIFTACVWLIMFMWAVLDCDFDYLSTRFWSFAKSKEVQVSWPDPLFRPEKIACDGDLSQIFLANKFRVFTATRDVQSNRVDNWQHLPCDIGISGIIQDLTVHCGQGGRVCRPLVLVKRGNDSSVIIDCLQQEMSGPGAVQGLRMRSGNTEFAAVNSSTNLMMVGQGQEMVVYGPAKNGSREPLYDFVLHAGNIASVDYSGSWVYVFSNVRKGLSVHAIEVRSSTSLVVDSKWGVATEIMPLRGGCGADSGLEALVLSRPYAFGSTSKLFHLQRQ